MTSDLSSLAGAAVGPARGTLPLKSVIAVIVGNWLEFYDFLVFTFFAVMMVKPSFPASLR